jgi:hypothetical protein
VKIEIVKLIALLATEYPNMPAFSDDRIEMWIEQLSVFPPGSVMQAGKNHMRTSRFAPQLAEIVAACQAQAGGGWLGADEAWAMMPKSEAQSAMMTNELSQAMAAASPLLEEGEQNAARMAFRATYSRLVEQAKIEGRAPRYFLSQGTDFNGRIEVLATAVRAKQIGLDAAISLLPSAANELTSAAGAPNRALLSGPSAAGMAKVKQLMSSLKQGGNHEPQA